MKIINQVGNNIFKEWKDLSEEPW